MFIKAVFKTTFGLSDVLNVSPRNGHVILVTLAYIEGWTVVQSYGRTVTKTQVFSHRCMGYHLPSACGAPL